jgi:hypothetical protein
VLDPGAAPAGCPDTCARAYLPTKTYTHNHFTLAARITLRPGERFEHVFGDLPAGARLAVSVHAVVDDPARPPLGNDDPDWSLDLLDHGVPAGRVASFVAFNTPDLPRTLDGRLQAAADARGQAALQLVFSTCRNRYASECALLEGSFLEVEVAGE